MRPHLYSNLCFFFIKVKENGKRERALVYWEGCALNLFRSTQSSQGEYRSP
jgi:hypothetical protein